MKAREECLLSLVSDGLQPLFISQKSDSALIKLLRAIKYTYFSLTLAFALQVAVN